MACQWISLWLSPSQFGSFLTAPTISVYTGVLLGSFYAVYRNSHNVELVRSLFWSCASVRRKRRRSGRWISSTIIYLTHIHGRGRGSYLVITSSFVFGNLLLPLFLAAASSRIRSCVEWEMGWFWDMRFRGFVRFEWEEEGEDENIHDNRWNGSGCRSELWAEQEQSSRAINISYSCLVVERVLLFWPDENLLSQEEEEGGDGEESGERLCRSCRSVDCTRSQNSVLSSAWNLPRSTAARFLIVFGNNYS